MANYCFSWWYSLHGSTPLVGFDPFACCKHFLLLLAFFTSESELKIWSPQTVFFNVSAVRNLVIGPISVNSLHAVTSVLVLMRVTTVPPWILLLLVDAPTVLVLILRHPETVPVVNRMLRLSNVALLPVLVLHLRPLSLLRFVLLVLYLPLPPCRLCLTSFRCFPLPLLWRLYPSLLPFSVLWFPLLLHVLLSALTPPWVFHLCYFWVPSVVVTSASFLTFLFFYLFPSCRLSFPSLFLPSLFPCDEAARGCCSHLSIPHHYSSLLLC